MSQAVLDKITFLLAFGMSWFGIIKAIQVWAQENSTGKKAIGEVAGKLEAIRLDTEKVKQKMEVSGSKNEELERSVKRLDEHVSELIQTMFKYVQGKSR